MNPINPMAAADTSTTSTTSSPSSTEPGGNILDKNAFLKLMMVQLEHQDPLNASDPSQYINELSQLTALEQQTNTAKYTAQAASEEHTVAALQLPHHRLAPLHPGDGAAQRRPGGIVAMQRPAPFDHRLDVRVLAELRRRQFPHAGEGGIVQPQPTVAGEHHGTAVGIGAHASEGRRRDASADAEVDAGIDRREGELGVVLALAEGVGDQRVRALIGYR